MTNSLYINDLIPMINLSNFQKESIVKLLNAIDNKTLKLEFNNCLCNNQNVGNDIIIAEKDRYGIPVKNLICSKCGLIRSEKHLMKTHILVFISITIGIYMLD